MKFIAHIAKAKKCMQFNSFLKDKQNIVLENARFGFTLADCKFDPVLYKSLSVAIRVISGDHQLISPVNYYNPSLANMNPAISELK